MGDLAGEPRREVAGDEDAGKSPCLWPDVVVEHRQRADLTVEGCNEAELRLCPAVRLALVVCLPCDFLL